MPDLEQMLAEAQANQKKKKFARGLRPDHLTREPVSPTPPTTSMETKPAIEKIAIAKTIQATERTNIAEFATADAAIAEPAIVSSAQVNSAIDVLTTAKSVTAKITIAKLATPNRSEPTDPEAPSAIVNLSIAKIKERHPIAVFTEATPAIAKTTIAYTEEGEGNSRKSTQVEYVTAKTTIAALADKKHGYTRVDNYVFDSLLPSIENPAAALLYLYLWRRTIGFQKLSVELSHQILSDAVGISKRTVQEAIALLNDKGLVKTTRAYSTAIPRHTIQKPWLVGEDFSDAMADNPTAAVAIGDASTAQTAGSYSENCQAAIAASATTKRKVLNKENKSLSLPEIFKTRLATLTESQAKREREGFEGLSRQYPGEGEEIAETLHFLASTGKDLSGAPLRSPMGLLLTNYPQVRNYLRERSAAATGAQVRKQEQAQLKAQELEKEQLEADMFRKRETAFSNAFKTEEEQRLAIDQWGSAAPWIRDKQGPLARHFAINAWASQRESELSG